MLRATLSTLSLVMLPVVMAGAQSLSERDLAERREEVRRAEEAFARTMADRDHRAFQTFLADEAIFWGRDGASRGKASVAAAWAPLFTDAAPPFSWQPDTVDVLDSGTLAFSSGPVYGPGGERIGTFNSVWRRDADGRWRVVFDKGCPPCRCP